jgi:hypothetical protein
MAAVSLRRFLRGVRQICKATNQINLKLLDTLHSPHPNLPLPGEGILPFALAITSSPRRGGLQVGCVPLYLKCRFSFRFNLTVCSHLVQCRNPLPKAVVMESWLRQSFVIPTKVGIQCFVNVLNSGSSVERHYASIR